MLRMDRVNLRLHSDISLRGHSLFWIQVRMPCLFLSFFIVRIAFPLEQHFSQFVISWCIVCFSHYTAGFTRAKTYFHQVYPSLTKLSALFIEWISIVAPRSGWQNMVEGPSLYFCMETQEPQKERTGWEVGWDLPPTTMHIIITLLFTTTNK